MTPRHDDDPRLPADEQAFVARLADHLTPPPLTPARRAAFDRALAARVELRRRRRMLTPLLVAATATAALAVAILSGRTITVTSRPVATVPPVVANAVPTVQWENQLVSATDIDDASTWDRQDLPADYEAIANVWLAG